jgi:ribosomal protein S18 acetylase RimI-like enzyme
MPKKPGLKVRPAMADDRAWMSGVLERWWGSTRVVTRGIMHDALALDAFIAVRDSERIGLATYRIEGDSCELVTLNALVEGAGVGTALIEAVRKGAIEAGCTRFWLITTNDNTSALRFYQKRGWRIVAVHRDALEQSRRLKPEIPLVGLDGIALRDEIELELPLVQG